MKKPVAWLGLILCIALAGAARAARGSHYSGAIRVAARIVAQSAAGGRIALPAEIWE